MSITLVTAFYDLNKYEKRPSDRNRSNYLEWAEFLFKLKINIVFFVEEDDKNYIIYKRMTYGNEDRTKVISRNLLELPWNGNNRDIEIYLKEHPIKNGTKDKDSNMYLSLTWNKTYFVDEIIDDNPFNSEYFGWIDFGIYHVVKNKMPLQEINEDFFIPENDKIKVMELRCVTENEIKDINRYTSYFRWKIAGGLWVGHKSYLRKFTRAFKSQLYRLLSMRIAAHEETIFSIIYYFNRELFDPYYGDYWDILANYKKTRFVNRIFDNIILSKNSGSYNNVETIGLKLLNDCYNELTPLRKFTLFDELTSCTFYIDIERSNMYVEMWLEKLEEDREHLEVLRRNKERIRNNLYFYDNKEKLLEKLDRLLEQ